MKKDYLPKGNETPKTFLKIQKDSNQPKELAIDK